MKTPKIILLDIETAPSLGFYFDLYKEGNIVATVKSWYILSFAYKTLGGKTHCMALPNFPKLYAKDKEDDSALVAVLHAVLEEADIIVAHNGDRFDLRKINARFLKYGMAPPSPYKTVDTLKVARKCFALDSNRLNDIGKYLGVGSKLPHTGFKLWEDCMAGDKKAWGLMKRYNVQDVELLDSVYHKLLPWMTNHPNIGVYAGIDHHCPNCGGTLTRRGFLYTKTGRKQRYQCDRNRCWSTDSKTEKVVSVS